MVSCKAIGSGIDYSSARQFTNAVYDWLDKKNIKYREYGTVVTVFSNITTYSLEVHIYDEKWATFFSLRWT